MPDKDACGLEQGRTYTQGEIEKLGFSQMCCSGPTEIFGRGAYRCLLQPEGDGFKVVLIYSYIQLNCGLERFIIFCQLSNIMSRIITKPVTFGGPTTEGSPYWKFKNDIKEVFRNHKKVSSEFGIEIELFLKKSRVAKDKNDLDNFLKPIIDALNEISIIEEHMMKSIKINRILVDGSNEGVDITFL